MESRFRKNVTGSEDFKASDGGNFPKTPLTAATVGSESSRPPFFYFDWLGVNSLSDLARVGISAAGKDSAR